MIKPVSNTGKVVIDCAASLKQSVMRYSEQLLLKILQHIFVKTKLTMEYQMQETFW